MLNPILKHVGVACRTNTSNVLTWVFHEPLDPTFCYMHFFTTSFLALACGDSRTWLTNLCRFLLSALLPERIQTRQNTIELVLHHPPFAQIPSIWAYSLSSERALY